MVGNSINSFRAATARSGCSGWIRTQKSVKLFSLSISISLFLLFTVGDTFNFEYVAHPGAFCHSPWGMQAGLPSWADYDSANSWIHTESDSGHFCMSSYIRYVSEYLQCGQQCDLNQKCDFDVSPSYGPRSSSSSYCSTQRHGRKNNAAVSHYLVAFICKSLRLPLAPLPQMATTHLI